MRNMKVSTSFFSWLCWTVVALAPQVSYADFYDTQSMSMFGQAGDYDYESDELFEEECLVDSHPAILPMIFDCGPFSGDIFAGYDIFRSLPEGSWEGNTGALIGFNLGFPVSWGDCNMFGAQIGASYGIYDWSGRGFTPQPHGNGEVQQQAFLTFGASKMSPYCCGVNYGLVLDWQFNKNASVFGLNPSLGQVRGQVGFEANEWDEFGFWATAHVNSSTKSTFGVPVKFQAINQFNLFWRRDYLNCARTMLWVGLPYGDGLFYRTGRAGRWILGGSFKVPLTDCFSIEGHASYMRAKKNNAIIESENYASNICIGISYSFGHPRGSQPDCFDLRPYMPLADNSSFIVDTNLNN